MSSNKNQINKNQNNKENKTVLPITNIIDKHVHNTLCQSNITDTSANEAWVVQSNIRNHSCSSNSGSLNSPKTPTQPIKKKLFASRNRFEVFSQPVNSDDIQNATNSMNNIGQRNTDSPIKSPPPIFVKGVEDFPALCTNLIKLLGVENFFCKSSMNRLKIQTSTPETYRMLIHFLKDQNSEYHTYQLQQDKPTSVVIRNLHPSTQTSLIKSELVLGEFEVRNVTNVLHKVHKHPLPLFFVDLEPSPQSNDIYKLTSILHTKIKVEEPHKPKIISQCLNCQEYGHTKSYCNYSSRCVRCSDHHLSFDCTISRDTLPKCALCQGNHPASYRGCIVYKEIQRLLQTMFSCLIMLDLRIIMYKLATQKVMRPQIILVLTFRLPLANAQHILLLLLNPTLIMQ